MTLTYPYRYLFDFDATGWSTPGPTAYDHLPADGGLVVLTRPTATKPFFAVPRSDVDVHRIGTRWLLYCDSASAADIDVIQYTPAGGGSYSVRWTETLSPGDAAEVIYLGGGNYAHRKIAAPAAPVSYTPPASAVHRYSAHAEAGADGDTVTTLPDLIGSADISISAPSAAAKITEINGVKWVRRNATNTLIRAIITSIPQPWTLLMTWRYPVAPGSTVHNIYEGNASFLTPRCQYVPATPRIDVNMGNGTRSINGSLNLTDPFALILVANGASSKAWIRGALTNGLDPFGATTNSATGTQVAWAMGTAGGIDTSVGELMICNAALSDAEINAWGAQAQVSWTDV